METPPRSPITTALTRADFMRLVGTSFGLVAFTNCVSACARDTAEVAPAATVDFTINWGKSPYNNLQQKGGYVVEQNVIIAQTLAGTFLAVSAICTHANATLTFQGASNRFYCPSHQSTFGPTGTVLNGPATTALKAYTVTVNQSTGDIRVQG